MGGQQIQLGPFTGGLNLATLPRLIKDDELASCVNFDIGDNGDLLLRPGIRNAYGHAGSTNAEILGVAKISAVANEIYTQALAAGVYTVYSTADIHAAAPVARIAYGAGIKAGDALQYNNK